MQKISIFPTNIWKFSIDESERVNKGLLEYIQSLKSDPDSVTSGKSQSKWHTTRRLHDRSQMSELTSLLLNLANLYSRRLMCKTVTI